jgi:predicted  nucleic acid-binding Zn-ribbon protein
MHEDIRLLKELQDVDYWIGELERSREFLPEMMRNLETEIEQIAVDLKTKKERLIAAQLEMKEIELSVAEHKEHVGKYQEQMLTIKTNKEYDALVVQIDASKTQIAGDEERSLALMTEIEELKAAVAALEEKTLTIRDQNNDKLKELQFQMDSVQGKVDEKEAQRDHLKAKVPKSVMAIYERVRKGRGGDVVVRLRRGACGECYKSQPPQKVQLVKRGDSLQTCASCGRILIWEGDD